jgi:hypothetical protein
LNFTFNNNFITTTNITAVDFRLLAQYAQLFNKNNVFVPPGTVPQEAATSTPAQQNNSVINLFDE